MFDIKNKAVEAMIKTAIQHLGIDPEALLGNLASFQGFIVQWINGANARISGIEAEVKATNAKLDLILSHIEVEQNVGRTIAIESNAGKSDAGQDAG